MTKESMIGLEVGDQVSYQPNRFSSAAAGTVVRCDWDGIKVQWNKPSHFRPSRWFSFSEAPSFRQREGDPFRPPQDFLIFW